MKMKPEMIANGASLLIIAVVAGIAWWLFGTTGLLAAIGFFAVSFIIGRLTR